MAEALDIVYLDGEFLRRDEAAISPFDRGFLYGDGIYEVIACYGGKLFRLENHLQRLENGLSALHMKNPHDRAAWQDMLQSLLARNGGGNLNVYVQVTRGATPYRDHRFPANAKPTVFAMCQPAAPVPSEWLENGISVITREDIRWARCDIKTTALIANVLLRQAAEDAGAQECLLLRDGEATEYSASSLFAVKNGKVLTTPNSARILPGITGVVLRDLAANGEISLLEQVIPESLLRTADEIWLASTTREVLAVTRLDGKPVGDGKPGPLWRKTWEAFQAEKRKLAEA